MVITRHITIAIGTTTLIGIIILTGDIMILGTILTGDPMFLFLLDGDGAQDGIDHGTIMVIHQYIMILGMILGITHSVVIGEQDIPGHG